MSEIAESRRDSVTSNRQGSEHTWRDKFAAQPVLYEDDRKLSSVLERLTRLPDLVPFHEVDRLSKILELAARGEVFVVQGGDCAEAFHDVVRPIIRSKRQLLMEQATILSQGLCKPVVPIGRIAGQYSKPRSNCYEQLSCGETVNAYRGDNINGPEKTERSPDPERLFMGYHLAAVTLSVLQSDSRPVGGGIEPHMLPSTGIFTSHEALHLPLENAVTRYGYNTSAHMLWIGERTRQVDGAHVAFLRTVKNPIGIKLGPTTDAIEVLELMNILNPQKTPGKIVLITRMGAKNVEDKLPQILRTVKTSGHLPVWLCDPCHGNTVVTPSKVKTRIAEQMLEELKATHTVHSEIGTCLGGIHVEQTGEADVTECVDTFAQDLETVNLQNFRSLCDPRLSSGQGLKFVRDYVDFVQKTHEEDDAREGTVHILSYAQATEYQQWESNEMLVQQESARSVSVGA